MSKIRKTILLIISMTIAINIFAIEGLLVKTIDYSFQEKWYKTISTSIPKLISCDTVYKNQYFFLTAIAGDFAFDKNDLADVGYSIKIINPDNSIYFSQENLPLIKGKVTNKNYLQMSEAFLKISFEDNDLFGTYKIEIQILDKVSNQTKSIKSEIVLTELPKYEEFEVKHESELMNWFQRFYENPKPETALANYIFYSQSSLSDDDSNFLSLFSIFLEIFKNNPFLLPQVMDCYNQQDEKTKAYLLYLLHYSGIGTTEFYNNLEDIEKEIYLKIQDIQLPDMYGEITDPSQLDMLWATFTTNGSYQPILKLIQTLDYTSYQGELDKYESSNQTEEDRLKAMKNAIYDSLVWSIKSNCEQHDLVKSYCNWAFLYENLTDIQRKELKNILDKIE